MAASSIVIFDKALLNMLSATGLLSKATYNVTLHTSAWSPSVANNEVYADVSSEIAAGNGYTAGGKALGNVTLTMSSGAVKFTSDPVQWVASGGSIPAWRYGLIRAVGTYNGKIDPLVGYFTGDIGAVPASPVPVDIPATTAGNSLTMTPNTNGLVAATKA